MPERKESEEPLTGLAAIRAVMDWPRSLLVTTQEARGLPVGSAVRLESYHARIQPKDPGVTHELYVRDAGPERGLFLFTDPAAVMLPPGQRMGLLGEVPVTMHAPTRAD